MKRFKSRSLTSRIRLFAAGVSLCVGLAASPLTMAGNIEPEAEEILKSMSTYLGGMAAFSMNADIDLEIVTQQGQKLQLSSSAEIVMQRPAKFHFLRRGVLTDAEFIFDGKTLTLHGKNLNAYTQMEVPGTIDDAIRAYELETGLSAPGADLLFADPYAVLSSELESGVYVGAAYVNGVECHHLAFRKAKVDWQLWVKVGDQPLPMKYVITSKWHTGAPQYEIRLRDWNVNPKISDDQFVFSAPKGAKRLEAMPVNEWGELLTTDEGQ